MRGTELKETDKGNIGDSRTGTGKHKMVFRTWNGKTERTKTGSLGTYMSRRTEVSTSGGNSGMSGAK